MNKLNDFSRKKIENIDILWLNEFGSLIYAFEIETTTPITTGIDRFIELLKLEYNIAQRIVLVTPLRRKKQLNSILEKSHYIGHPMYMENKLVYLFIESLVEIYRKLANHSPQPNEILNLFDDYVVNPLKD